MGTSKRPPVTGGGHIDRWRWARGLVRVCVCVFVCAFALVFTVPNVCLCGGGGGGNSPGTPTTGLRERGNDTSRSTGRSGRQNAATRRNMRRDERVSVEGPIKKQQPDGMSHRGGGNTVGLPRFCLPCHGHK